MYSPNFDYYRASSIPEVAHLLQKHPGAKLLAGGHSLIPLLKLRLASPSALVDIGRVAELRGIAVEGNSIRIGALTTHAELSASPELRDLCPLLAEAAHVIGDPAVRNRGTIGGNVAHADPASDLPAALAALDATFSITGPGGARHIGAADFFQGMMATSIGEHDLLTAIHVPTRRAQQGAAYVKFAHPASRYAVIGVAALVTVEGGRCTAAAVGLGGLVPKPLRAASVEHALVGQPATPETMSAAAALVRQDVGRDVLGDLFASADYRVAVAPVWVKRALTSAAERI